MNTWFVGNHPIGHYVYQMRGTAKQETGSARPAQPVSTALVGEKTFFMKGRIMAGQADVEGNDVGVEDFKWLAKEEIQKEVSPQYWASVKNMLVEQ